MNQSFNPMNPPAEGRIPAEQIQVYGADLVAIMGQYNAEIQTMISGREASENKVGIIQKTGKLVWIVNRFVDIDFEKLKDVVPGLADGDHLMVLQDETHGEQCSVYKIYNTESIPNVRYLGFGNATLFPTVPAVEQFVNNQLAQSEKAINDLLDDIQAKQEEMDQKIQELTKQANDLTTLCDAMNNRIDVLEHPPVEEPTPES